MWFIMWPLHKHPWLYSDQKMNELVYNIHSIERNGKKERKKERKYKGVLGYSLINIQSKSVLLFILNHQKQAK